ncbi:hypothetical protein Pyn_14722 [Prunus yedoensis var. nudiflora]|uniref:Uncharacterized protein n=1 Tax=Prunus yedoensis var. nudiflora TaxID=2094558 RepID=A0A314UKS0_PRUYE|nr:hypothetical protein Pyn_14722 [Prunus yedoensis var. nudiflora]
MNENGCFAGRLKKQGQVLTYGGSYANDNDGAEKVSIQDEEVDTNEEESTIETENVSLFFD